MDGATTGLPPLERYRDYLVLLARVLLYPQLRTKLDPSDIAHDAYLRALQAIHQFRGDTEIELRSWLRQILVHTLNDQYRAFSAQNRDVKLERSLEDVLERSSARLEEWLGVSSDGAEAQLMKEEQLDRIARAINQLPENQRTAVELHYIHGYTLAQISQQMGRSQNAVGALIARGVKAIRKTMTETS
ncbi:MAG: sigma-70 family RNA polymerase sigma factor [Isosphaerales bacterium]